MSHNPARRERPSTLSNVRVFGVDLPNKRLCIALTYIYGIGPTTSSKICKSCQISEDIRVSELNDAQVDAIRNYITDNNLVIEGDLKISKKRDIQNLVDIRCYRGIRHKAGLPVRGQRTRTNARTRKGKVKAQVANKKKVVK